jgi:hypothetical protein
VTIPRPASEINAKTRAVQEFVDSMLDAKYKITCRNAFVILD